MDPEALIQHRDSIRRLALAMVHDPHTAEDVAQDALLIGLTPARARPRDAAGWLRGVTRNLARRRLRTSARQTRRESAVARDPVSDGTADVVARLHEHRRLLRLLDRLGEPTRSTLLLRYFEDLPPRVIAARQGIPVATVKSRLARGLVRLREDMDRAHDGRRGAWAGALVAGTGWGGTTMATGTKAWAGVGLLALLLAGFGLWWWMDDGADEPRPAAPVAPREVTPTWDPPKEAGAGLAARGGSEDPAPPKPAEEAVEVPRVTLTLRGRVVDTGRHPIGGARVELIQGGHVVGSTKSDAQGVFDFPSELALPRPSDTHRDATLRARGADGRSAYRRVVVARDGNPVQRLDPLVLRPAHDVTLLVRHADAPVVGARVAVGCGPKDTGLRFRLPSVQTDETGRARIEGVPEGHCSCLVEAPGLSVSAWTGAFPDADGQTYQLELAQVPPIDVSVVAAPDETPVAGAEIDLLLAAGRGIRTWSASELGWERTTDAQGRTTLPAVSPPVHLRIGARKAPHPEPLPYGASSKWVQPENGRARIVLAAVTTRVWPLAEESTGIADGTPVEIRDARRSTEFGGYRMPTRARIDKGRLVLRGAVVGAHVPFEALAVLPDGRGALLTWPKGSEAGPPISFGPLRTLRVRFETASGTPVRGAFVHVRGQPQELHAHIRARTDAEGRAEVTGLLPLDGHVSLTSVDPKASVTVPADLRERDVERVIVLPEPQAARVRITIDGAPALPAEYSLRFGGGGRSYLFPRDIEEDPVAGTLDFQLHEAQSLEGQVVVVAAPGLPQASGRFVRTGAGLVAEVALDGRGVMEIEVTPPPDGTYTLQVQRYAPEYKRWYPLGHNQPLVRVEGHRWRAGPFPKGRYRIREADTGVLGPAIDVVPAAGPWPVTLDLSKAGAVSGTVIVPSGVDMNEVRVLVHGREGGAGRPQFRQGPNGELVAVEPPGGIKPALDGRFSVRVPGDRPVRVVAWHPLLTAGPAHVTEQAATDVRLVLRAGPTASFEVDVPAKERTPMLGREVRLYRDAPRGDPLFTGYPVLRNGKLRFGGFAPGTYTLWIHGGGQAAIVRRALRLDAGPNPLGRFARNAGSTLRIRFLLDEKQDVGILRLRAQAKADASAIRSTFHRDATKPGELAGLAAGTWMLMVRSMRDASILAEQEVQVGAEGTTEVTVDLRAR